MSNAAPGPGAWADNYARDRTQPLEPAKKRTTERALGVSRHGLDDDLGIDTTASAVDYAEGNA